MSWMWVALGGALGSLARYGVSRLWPAAPGGFPVPTLKISSNTAIAEKKPHWIDLNAGAFLDGTATMDQLADDLFALVLDVASGRQLANNEKHGYREIAIWKEGVTL